MATANISLLLGSGFSIPEGLPGVSSINKRLSKIKESDFYLFSDQTAGFYHSDWKDPNAWMPNSRLDRQFVEDFTAFYVKEYLDSKIDQYNYEKFYDFISDFLRFDKEKVKIDVFSEIFNGKIQSKTYKQDSYNWVSRLKRIINQLIADLLFLPKHYEDVGYTNYPYYGGVFGLLREWLKENVVNVHTLNHDLFFDFIANRLTDLWQHYSDGYTEVGSSIYGQVSTKFRTDRGDVHKTYNVRLKYYNGVYENKLRLFKLHGSIDSYILRVHYNHEEIRVKKDFGVKDFLLERFDDEAQKYKYEAVFTDTHPDFLTGTTEKIRQYNIPFYEVLFDHFKKNLHNSSKLLVIGYGFQDKGINNLLEQHYLIFNKPVIVIDVMKPVCDLFDAYREQFHFLLKVFQITIMMNLWKPYTEKSFNLEI